MREALFYTVREGTTVDCSLCRHRCVIAQGKRGLCGVRENREGTLYSLVYGLPCAYHVDPIEKKPFYHFLPGSRAFSIATAGCNFQCLHCQNHEISQLPRTCASIKGDSMEPSDVVAMAVKAGCKSISFTYTEPTMFYEYALDTAKGAKEQGLFTNFVTNGYIEDEPLRTIKPFLDGANIDLKAFSDAFYRNVCKAELSKVLSTIRAYKSLNIWIEITTLVIPGHNDSDDELRAIARFIRDDLGPETPWHVSAFYPTYKLLDAHRTPPETLIKARDIGLGEGLRYVYVGNIPGSDGEQTVCYGCGKTIIKRYGYTILAYNLEKGRCAFCGAVIDGVGM
jgi:pyruvate formate lyase activating enzyme